MIELFFTLIFLLVFFYEIFFLKKVFFLGDNLVGFLPHKVFILESLKKGVLPLWNPLIWNGLPEISDSTIALFSPFNLIYFLLPDLKGITASAIISYFLSFLGTYLFLRNEKLSKVSSFLGAVIFTFSGSMINISLDINRLNTICFLPWILLTFKVKNFILTTIFMSLSILTGNFQYFYMTQFVIFGYLLFTVNKKRLFKNLFFYFLSLFFATGLTFFQIWPQINMLRYTTRDQAGLNYNTTWSLHPASLLRFFLADFWGKRTEGSFWGPDVTYTFGYVGLFPLLFIIISLKKLFEKKNPRKTSFIFYLVLSLFSLFISFGKFNPVYKFLLLIPGFSFFRNPSAWLIIYSFSLACLTAFLSQTDNFRKNSLFRKLMLFMGVFFTFFGLVCLYIFKFYPETPFTTLLILSSFLHKTLSSFHQTAIDRQICFLIGRNFLILGILSLILFRCYKRKTFLLVIFFDLFFFSKADLFLAPAIVNQYYQVLENSPQIKFLKENIGPMRFVSTAEFLPYRGLNNYIDNYFRLPPFIPENKWRLNKEEFSSYQIYNYELSLLPPNINLIPNIPSINGYSTFVFKDYYRFFQENSQNQSRLISWLKKTKGQNPNPPDPVSLDFDYISLEDPRIASLSVKYILSGEKLELKNHKEIKFANGFYVYENPEASSRAQILNQDNIVIQNPLIFDLNPNTVLVRISGAEPEAYRKLVLRDFYYPGWKAFDDQGKPLTVYKEEQIFRAVDLDKKTKSVTFKFIPDDFFFSLKVSGLFLLAFLSLSLGRFLAGRPYLRKKLFCGR